VRRAAVAWGLGAGGRGGGLGAGRPIAWGRQRLREESEMRDGETEKERLDEARVQEIELGFGRGGSAGGGCGQQWAGPGK